MLVYGILDLDVLKIISAKVQCLQPARVILTNYGELSGNGAEMYTNCSLKVGPWFECQLPDYSFVSGIDDVLTKSNYTISPNPFSEFTTICFNRPLTNSPVLVYNSLGQKVKELKNVSGESVVIQRENLPPGIYMLQQEGRREIIKVVIE